MTLTWTTTVGCARCKRKVEAKSIKHFACRACQVTAPMCAACLKTAMQRDRALCFECKDNQREFAI